MSSEFFSTALLSQRKKAWLRRAAWAVLFAALLAGAAGWYAVRNLTEIARWSFQRALPEAKVELGKLSFDSPGQVAIRRFALRDPASGKEMLRLAGGSVVFSLADLRRGRIGEVRLVDPVISIGPELSKLMAAGSGGKTKPASWLVARLACESGEIICPGSSGLSLHLKFSFDWKDVGPDSSAPLALVLSDIRAAAPNAAGPFLALEKCDIRFSPAGLNRGELDEVRLVNPTLSVTPSLLQLFSGSQGGGTGGAGWHIGRLACDYGEGTSDGFGPDKLSAQWKFAFDWNAVNLKSFAPLELVLWDVRASVPGFSEPFLELDLVKLQATPQGLAADHTVSAAAISGGRLVVGAALKKLHLGGPAAPAGESSDAAWKLGALDIGEVGVILDDARPGISDIEFQVNTTLRNLSLGQAADALGGEMQSVEIADLDVPSPLDPFTKVLTLRSIFLKFTLAGLLHQELDEITILHPTIYVGEDLFWYMDDAQKRMGSGQPGSPGWKVRKLDIKFGRLVLGSGGRAEYGLPLNFQTSAQDVSLDNLAALKMQAGLEIPAQDYAFESYQLRFSTQPGELRFAYPPEKKENNLVGTVRLSSLLWRQYRAADAWISTTFDQTGINGEFGGRFYGGYISGGFSFLFDDESPWIGWISGKGVDLRQLTDAAAPKNFRMTGPLAFKVQTNANGREIERLKGDFHASKPGHLTISKLDEFLSNLPPKWDALKKSSTRIALETLRDFDYKTAAGDFWIVREQGIVDLKLQGPQGSRNLKVVLHADESKEGRWKK